MSIAILPAFPINLGYQTKRFTGALATMWRVIFALMIRESRTRYGTSRIGAAWAIIDPLIQLLVLWGVYAMLGRHVPVPASLPVFLLTGIVPFGLWRACVSRGATAASSNVPLLTYPQVKVIDAVIARTLLETAATLIVAIVFMIGLRILYNEPFSSYFDEPAQLMLALATLEVLCMGSAVLSSGLTRMFPVWPEIWGYMGRILFFTSGIFFTLDALPNNLRAYAIYNPMAHVIEWIRSSALTGFESTHYSPFLVLSVSFVFLFFGLLIAWFIDITGELEGSH